MTRSLLRRLTNAYDSVSLPRANLAIAGECLKEKIGEGQCPLKGIGKTRARKQRVGAMQFDDAAGCAGKASFMGRGIASIESGHTPIM